MSESSPYGALVDRGRPTEDNEKARSAPHDDNFDFLFKPSYSATLQMEFADIFSEPDGTKSVPEVLEISSKTYKYTKNVVYAALTMLFSTILAFVWAIIFSLVAFLTVWIINPLLQLFFEFVKIAGKVYAICISLLCDPVFYSAGLVFSRFKHSFFFKPYPKALTAV